MIRSNHNISGEGKNNNKRNPRANSGNNNNNGLCLALVVVVVCCLYCIVCGWVLLGASSSRRTTSSFGVAAQETSSTTVHGGSNNGGTFSSSNKKNNKSSTTYSPSMAMQALRKELSKNNQLMQQLDLDFYETPAGEMRLHVHLASGNQNSSIGAGVVLTRLRQEVYYYIMHHSPPNQTWSERVVLELFFLRVSAGAGTPLQSVASLSKKQLYQNQQQTSGAKSSQSKNLMNAAGWMRDEVDICEWEGITCGRQYSSYKFHNKKFNNVVANNNSSSSSVIVKKQPTITPEQLSQVTKIALPYYNLMGTIPEELATLTALRYLDLRGNFLRGTLPEIFWTSWTQLHHLDLRSNQFTGTLSPTLAQNLQYLNQIWLAKNYFRGTVPDFVSGHRLEWFDISYNHLSGTLPRDVISQMTNLLGLCCEHNHFSGKLPGIWATQLTRLQVLDVGNNDLTGTVPKKYGTWITLRDLNLAGNQISSKRFPTQLLRLTNLEHLILGQNQFHGTIPVDDSKDNEEWSWSLLSNLQHIMWNDNYLEGTLPKELLTSVRGSITSIDISYNSLTGTIPVELATLKKLERIDAMANYFTGTLPLEMNRMNPNLELNFTNNFITGSVPNMFCGGGPNSMNFLYRQFGCDAVLCPAGTFHPAGAATLHSGCKRCPHSTSGVSTSTSRNTTRPLVPAHKILGRSTCASSTIVVNGDVDGDGLVSAREVLRLLFVETIGRFWGPQFQNWIDMNMNECDLIGVTCVNGLVAKLDLSSAAMCTSGEYTNAAAKSGGAAYSLLPDCRGIPAEVGLLKRMEVITLSKRQFLRGTLPSEIGKLTRLKYMDVSDCPNLSGKLPSELGKLTKLKYFNVAGSGFNGTVPPEVFTLAGLEKLHLSNNHFSGTIPANSVGKLENVKELFYSNNYLNGTIPSSIGNLSKLENLEMYGNELSGTIPDALAKCSNLKRFDVFNNKLSGNIPKALAEIEALQILHLKMNVLTGTIPSQFGELPYLSWFDVSYNRLHGTIPSSFGSSRSIKDFRLGSNMIYDPVPQSLCTNTNLNGGITSQFGCDGVICPLGTYSDSGHATYTDNGCKKCPAGETNMYLGSSSCQKLNPSDILSIMFDAMEGSEWPEELRENWKHPQIDICYWSGVICDTNGELVSLGFPIHWDMFLRDGVAFNDPYYSPPSSS